MLAFSAYGTGSAPDPASDTRGPITREQLILQNPFRWRRSSSATGGTLYGQPRQRRLRNLALALLKHFEKFFAFLSNEGVEPTNNSAERALRCAVQWRKISFGSRSTQGEIAVARLLTATRTCRAFQGREPLDYLGSAIRSHRKAQPVPSLLKTASTT